MIDFGRRRIVPLMIALMAQLAAASAQDITAQFSRFDARSTQTVDHSAWEQLLSAYVVAGADKVNHVDYSRLKAQGHAQLKAYLSSLQTVNVSSLARPEQFAFWANLYNAATVDVVLERYPVASIRDIKPGIFATGPWGMKVVRVEGIELSLDDIEHKILRPIWHDPRVHYAVNCASIGCPNLQHNAFTGAKLDAMLNAAARAYINHPRGISVSGGSVRASQIYSWYVADFGGDAAGVLRHVRRYAQGDLARQLGEVATISGYDYDWRLNDAAAAP